jgi:hypothetical protein
MKKSLPPLALGLALAACAEDEPDYRPEELAAARTAIPSLEQLGARMPAASASAALGEPAEFPGNAAGVVHGINGAVGGIVTLMRSIVELPPSHRDRATREFVWGPFENEHGVGHVAAYIRETDEEFRYHYALLRGATPELDEMTPVIWGGATPGATDQQHGLGITLWDLEANRLFEEAHDPAHDPSMTGRGRFVALYGRGDEPAMPAAEFTFVVAVFRGFVSDDNPAAAPADLDYFYGQHAGPQHTADFIDFSATIDVSKPEDGVQEQVAVHMAFLDQGSGRAEASATGGSLASSERVTATECWNNALAQTYLRMERWDGAVSLEAHDLGQVQYCGPVFASSLDQLGVPTLGDIDAGLRAELDRVARTGLP